MARTKQLERKITKNKLSRAKFPLQLKTPSKKPEAKKYASVNFTDEKMKTFVDTVPECWINDGGKDGPNVLMWPKPGGLHQILQN